MINKQFYRLLIFISLICVVSIFINIRNYKQLENMRQVYVNSIFNNLVDLEIIFSDLYHLVKNEENLSSNCTLENFNYTIMTLDNNLKNLMWHHNRRWQAASMSAFRRHVLELPQQMKEGDIEIILDFLKNCSHYLSVLVQEFTAEDISEWNINPNLSISPRQLFRLINDFEENIHDEIRRNRYALSDDLPQQAAQKGK